MKKKDIVYFVKNTAKNPELVHSVRSVCQNFPYRKIWFLGGCPEGILPDCHIPVQPISRIKTQVTANLFKIACTNDDITEDFILFNDDFFIMKEVTELPPRYHSTLDVMAERIERLYGHQTRYTKLLDAANDALLDAGYENYNFDLHIPMIINKKKMLKVMDKFPGLPCKRSLYGNYYELWKTGIEKPDVKVHDTGIVLVGSDFVSTDDGSFNKGEIGRMLRNKFADKCMYEV